ncbi:hypothetical protein PHLGIDRAFT_119540 [Phlebiopsis gigantea 11061_1 CR5-6]|uniref:Uncharacterized protein n=1 Tax=Phlebiopsis gigantea (strain 11061_1 CR5-6) TaxID=745531 RepID=A0A0C3NL70_PHLG1|nr:hypothetical protein PHLGIDRAFT_119540 [Phlebiopsis gigantea 11061_1 CR5-6]
MVPLAFTSWVVLATSLSLVLYGVYLVMFTMSVHSLLNTKVRSGSVNKAIVAAVFLLFATITAQCIISLTQLLVALNNSNSNDIPTDVLLLNEVSSSLNIAGLALFLIEIFVSDLLMIYRLWVIWQRSWPAVVPPIICYIACIACSGIFLHDISILPSGSDLFNPADTKWLIAGVAMTCTVTIYCTCLLSYKLWSSQRAVRHATTYSRSWSAYRIIAVLVESAALYTACNLALLFTFAFGSLGSYIVQDVAAPMTGIALSLITTRFGMGGGLKTNPRLSNISRPPSNNFSSSQYNELIATKPIPEPMALHLGRSAHTSNTQSGVYTHGLKRSASLDV